MIQPEKNQLDMYIIEGALLGNSETIAIGDAVIFDPSAPSTVIGAAGTTGIILGTVRAIKNGKAGGNVFLQETSVATASDNTTAAQINVDILPVDSPSTMLADLDAAAGTTTNSQYFGYFNLSGSVNGQLDESSYSASSEKQFLSFGVNPANEFQVIGVWTKIARS